MLGRTSPPRVVVTGALALGIALAGTAGSCLISFPEDVEDGLGAGGVPGGGAPTGGAGGDGGSGGDGGDGGVPLEGGGGSPPSSPCTTADEFDTGSEPSSSCWTVLNGANAVDAVSNDHLEIRPMTNIAWFATEQGYFLHRPVTGAFAVVAQVNASDPLDFGEAPDGSAGSYMMAGLLLRDPVPNKWVKWETGYRADDPDGAGGAPDNFDGEPVGLLGAVNVGTFSSHILPRFGADVQLGHSGLLGVCRAGNNVYLYSNLDGSSGWVRKTDPFATLAHKDFLPLPETLEVGMIAVADTGLPSNIMGRFDFIRFAEGVVVESPDDCQELLEALVEAGPDPSCACP